MSEKPIVPVIVDTNVLVPSLYLNTHIARFIKSGILILIWNDYIYREACEIIYRLAPLYHRRAGVYPEETLEILNLISQLGSKVPEMPDDWPPVSSDRDDDPFLWAAWVGGAEYIISDDYTHILRLKSFKGIPIGRPGTFFRWIKIAHPMPS